MKLDVSCPCLSTGITHCLTHMYLFTIFTTAPPKHGLTVSSGRYFGSKEQKWARINSWPKPDAIVILFLERRFKILHFISLRHAQVGTSCPYSHFLWYRTAKGKTSLTHRTKIETHAFTFLLTAWSSLYYIFRLLCGFCWEDDHFRW